VSPRDRYRRSVGAGPVAVLTLVASFAFAGAAVVGWFQRPRDVVSVLEWFVAAIVLHDLFMLPLYTWLDRLLLVRWHNHHLVRGRGAPRVSPTPFVRIPVMLSALLLLVFFPVIFGFGQRSETVASGIPEHGYLARWLLASGVLFALSGVFYLVARARSLAAVPEAGDQPGATSGPGGAC
jgi:hypothetical protein